MTIHVGGSDLARVYAAGLRAAGSSVSPITRAREARGAVQDFLDTLETIDGKPPHVGDPFVWERDPDSLPARLIGRDDG